METKINYQELLIEEIETLKGRKPRLLLHSCCGPCSTYPLTFLCPHFEVTLFYDNSNIYPEEEYRHRLEEQIRFLDCLERDYGYSVDIIVPEYDHEAYMEDLRPLCNEREGGSRCLLCYEKRMDKGFRYANANGYEYFSTLMTVSRQKDSKAMNEIGEKLSKKYPNAKYLHGDFKKDDGNLIGRRIARSYRLYEQNYCGCEYSLRREDEEPSK